MYTDVHCHIIPGVDDGSTSYDMSFRMLEKAAAQGIDTIICTPHVNSRTGKRDLERQIRHFGELKKAAGENFPGIRLFKGSEIMYFEGLGDLLANGVPLTMNGTQKVLVEFPDYAGFNLISSAVKDIMYAGFTPIIAHTERYEGTKSLDNIDALKESGAYIQVNTGSLIGVYGFIVQNHAKKIVKSELCDLLATDSHNISTRSPLMIDAAKYVEKRLGEDYAEYLTRRAASELFCV